MGYHRAGFEVVGIDINPQPNYPFEYAVGDVLERFAHMLDWYGPFDAVHASPPCQAYTSMGFLGKQPKERPALIEPVREMVKATGLPYIIENVPRAPLIEPVTLCGQYFGLAVRRHRLFECSFPVEQPNCLPLHKPHPIAVYGDHPEHHAKSPGTGGKIYRAHTLEMGREAMGIDWMTWKELTQAIPPAYTEYIGKQLLAS